MHTYLCYFRLELSHSLSETDFLHAAHRVETLPFGTQVALRSCAGLHHWSAHTWYQRSTAVIIMIVK